MMVMILLEVVAIWFRCEMAEASSLADTPTDTSRYPNELILSFSKPIDLLR